MYTEDPTIAKYHSTNPHPDANLIDKTLTFHITW